MHWYRRYPRHDWHVCSTPPWMALLFWMRVRASLSSTRCIWTNCADGVVVVDVEDAGPGLSAVTTSELFQEISRSSCPGHDLNLALSKSIAQNHGGDVIVDCRRQGRGA